MNEEIAEFSEKDVPEPTENLRKKIFRIARMVGAKEAVRNFVKLLKYGAVMATVDLSVMFCVFLTQPKVYAAVSDIFKTVV